MYMGNVEPTLSELLNDPVVEPLLIRDGLTVALVRGLIDDARRKYRKRERDGRSDCLNVVPIRAVA